MTPKYSEITKEQIEKDLTELFYKGEINFETTVTSISPTHYEIKGKGIHGIISKEEWNKAMQSAIDRMSKRTEEELEADLGLERVYLARGNMYRLEGSNEIKEALKDRNGKYYYLREVVKKSG